MNKVWEEDINNLYSDFKEKEDRILFLQQELQRKDNIINELEKWLEEQHQFIIEIPAFTKEISQEHKVMECCYEDVLDKIKELEENK